MSFSNYASSALYVEAQHEISEEGDEHGRKFFALLLLSYALSTISVFYVQ
jgi:hypothetical protein